MNSINTQLNILIDVLDNKNTCLQEILNFTNEQASLLENEELDFDAFNTIMQRKQILIDKIIEMDEGFQAIYEKVRNHLDTQIQLYKDKVSTMKQRVIEIGDISIAITVQEERNKLAFINKSREEKSKVKEFRKSKKTVANYYANMNKQNNSDTSHFFDSKK